MPGKRKKIIALLPFKNEEKYLPSYLSSVSKISDAIIALDDNSTDNSKKELEKAGAVVINSPFQDESLVNMSRRRSFLLKKGRELGGTHFVWLDADETFSSDFIAEGRERISNLFPGEKLSLRWVHLWKSTRSYLNDPTSPFGFIWKDFIVCDDPQYTFENKSLSENRTPGPYDHNKYLQEQHGVVLHFQFTDWHQTQIKQAWYRCNEYLQQKRSAKKINYTYSITLDNPSLKTEEVHKKWVKDTLLPVHNQKQINKTWQYRDIMKWFNEHGIEFFEPLQIWHIPELRETFIEQTGREPKPQTFPSWLVKVNEWKNKLF